MQAETPIRLAFVDDHPTLLTGLAVIFAEDARYEIVATGASAHDAIDIARDKRPEVMILDLSMPGDVFAAIDSFAHDVPTKKLVVFTAFASVDLALRALDAGAHGFVLKGRPAEDLYEAIDAVSRGELYVSPDFSQRVMAGFRNKSRRDTGPTAKLSDRELQLIDCLLKGQSNKEIAHELQLAEKTVKHYMSNLMTKLKVKNRLEVLLVAQELRRKSELDAIPPHHG